MKRTFTPGEVVSHVRLGIGVVVEEWGSRVDAQCLNRTGRTSHHRLVFPLLAFVIVRTEIKLVLFPAKRCYPGAAPPAKLVYLNGPVAIFSRHYLCGDRTHILATGQLLFQRESFDSLSNLFRLLSRRP
jgi:hypothetical protein